MCPGNNESAGKKKSGRTPRGNNWLKRVLTQCAWGARRTETHIGRSFRRLERRIGGKRAAVAVGHKILVIAFHLLLNGTVYEERNAHLNPEREVIHQKLLIAQLERAGFKVTKLEPSERS